MYWDDFTAKTGVRGFAFVQQTNNVGEKLFWYSVIVTSIILTMLDIHETWTTFYNIPTNTVVLVMDNSSVILPRPTLCIPIQVDHLAFLQSNFDQTVLSEIEFLTKFSENYNTIFNETNWKFIKNDLLIWAGLITATVSNVIRAEHGVRPDRNVTESWGVFVYAEHKHHLSKVLHNVAAFYQKRSVSLRYLMTIAGQLICRFINITLTLTLPYSLSEDQSLIPCLNGSITWLGQFPFDHYGTDALCIKLPTEPFTFRFPADSVKISFDVASLYPNVSELPWNGYASLDFTGMEVITPMSQNLLWLTPGDFRSINIQITGHYKQMNQGRRPCADQLQQKCKLECRLRYIENSCGCVPLSRYSTETIYINNTCGHIKDLQYIIDGNKNIDIEGFAETEECRLIFKSKMPDLQCASDCPISCNYHSYSYQILTIQKLNFPHETSLQIYMDPLRYPVFEELSSMSGKQMLARLAGNLSLYLGANLVVLVHVVVFWIKAFFSSIISPNQSNY